MRPSPSRALVLSLVTPVLAGLLAGCASSGRSGSPPAGAATIARSPRDAAALVHLLSRTTFAATSQLLASVERSGVESFLDRQMHPDRIDDGALEARLAPFETLKLNSKDIAERYYQPAIAARRARQAAISAAPAAAAPPGVGQPRQAAPPVPTAEEQEAFRKERMVMAEASAQKVLRAVYSQRQLQEVLVDFWFNHFNVFAGKGADRGLVTAYERDVIRPYVFGTFRELLGATAESPAMLFYLDNWMSVDPNGPHPAANLSISLRPRLLGPGPAIRRPLPGRMAPGAPPPQQMARPPARAPKRGLNENYARELMELHTLGVDGGYTQQDVIEVARSFTGWTIAQPREGGEFRFDARQHDPGQKLVLGRVIGAGGGKRDGDAVLDILARHPATARFIATKLVRRFVSDSPPPDLVDRVAKRFRDTNGDLRAVYRAIFTSREFRAAGDEPRKVKSPFEFVVSAVRATGAEITNASGLVQAVRTLGMPIYGCATPNGYGDSAETWVNTGALLDRMNFALALVANRVPGVRLDIASLSGSSELAAVRTALLARLLDNRASPATRSSIEQAATLPQIAALTIGSPEFQRR